jgi:four helix bundle protein
MQEKGYKKLKVYQEAHALVIAVYRATDNFPKSEMFGLSSQMRRAAVSIPANIIEGQARAGKKEFKRFLDIANGSLAELEYYLELIFALGYVSEEKYMSLEERRIATGNLLGGLIRKLKATL